MKPELHTLSAMPCSNDGIKAPKLRRTRSLIRSFRSPRPQKCVRPLSVFGECACQGACVCHSFGGSLSSDEEGLYRELPQVK